VRRLGALLLALALPAFADDVATTPPAPSGPRQIVPERTLDPDTKETKAGALEGGARALAFSADGKLLAVGAANGAISVARLDASSEGWTRVGEHLGSVAGVTFLARPDRLALASAGDDEALHVATIDAGLACVSSATRSLGIGPLTALVVLDADRVVVGSARGSLAVVRVGSSLAVERTIERHEGAVVALASLGGNKVASAGADGAVKVTDAASGKELRSVKVSNVELTALAATSDGRGLAVGCWKKGVQILDAATLKVVATVEPHRGAASALLLVGPPKSGLEKSRLVSASLADETLCASEALGAKPELHGLKRTRVAAVPAGGLAVSPDGRLVACSANDGTIGLYTIAGATK
jgi:WD40 repeat protein